jgi:hypothetical protein
MNTTKLMITMQIVLPLALMFSGGCNFGFGEKSSQSAYGSGNDGLNIAIDRDDEVEAEADEATIQDTGAPSEDVEDSSTDDTQDTGNTEDTDDLDIQGDLDTSDTGSPSPYPEWCATDSDIDGDGDDSCQCGGIDLDDDGDGYDAQECGGDDCNDGFSGTNPGVEEYIGDGQDNDCDGDVDEDDSDVDTGDTGIADDPVDDTGSPAPAPADVLTVTLDSDVENLELWVGSDSIGWGTYMVSSPDFMELSVIEDEYEVPIPASWNGTDVLKVNAKINDGTGYLVYGVDTDGDLINDFLEDHGVVRLNGADCSKDWYLTSGDYVCW